MHFFQLLCSSTSVTVTLSILAMFQKPRFKWKIASTKHHNKCLMSDWIDLIWVHSCQNNISSTWRARMIKHICSFSYSLLRLNRAAQLLSCFTKVEWKSLRYQWRYLLTNPNTNFGNYSFRMLGSTSFQLLHLFPSPEKKLSCILQLPLISEEEYSFFLWFL